MRRRLDRGLRRAFDRSRWPAGGIVLAYHRVAQLESDPQRLAVSPRRFAEHLDVIRQHGEPMALATLVDGARQGVLPAGAVAVTIDDGYADNLHGAAPLLVDRQMPATFFVSTGAVEHGREFWWDELERVLLTPGTLPEQLRLPVAGGFAEWDLASAAHLTDRDCAQFASWTVDQSRCPTPRHRVYVDLCQRLRAVGGDTRDRTLAELSRIAGRTREARTTHRPLRVNEVAALARTERFIIGSHTASHSSLPCLTPNEQRQEISGARRFLESVTRAPVTTFAYPFGGGPDVSGVTARIAQDEGITIACSTQPDSVRTDTPAHAVPRLIVRDWTKAEFLREWRQWTGA